MAPVKNKKRASDPSANSRSQGASTDTQVPVKSPSTPPHKRSPIKKRKMGITTLQKQALIDNLQLEVTERARRLRAQYQLQAQGLRSRIEIRINRIPTSLRKLKMGDLLLKYSEKEQSRPVAMPPPVPAKDSPRASPQRMLAPRAQTAGRGYKRLSSEIAGDKENDVENLDGKKRPRTETGRVRPAQVLSPTSSNSRLGNRDRPASPTKPQIPRPGSPLKSTAASRAAATSVLSSMVEKAKASRTRGTRKVTTTSEASSASNGTTAAAKIRRPATATGSRAPASRPATRTGRRPSETSETSEGSAGTVIRNQSAAKKATTAVTRTTVMGTIRRGVTGAAARRTTAKAAPAPPATTTATGRVLRKRG